jgi:5-methylcytosine-specific restriction endonuclease McrA
MKFCKICELEKTGSHPSYCKSCNSARVVAWKKANREKYNAYMKSYVRNNQNKNKRIRKPLTDEQKMAANKYKAKWRSKNLDKCREYDRKRRTLKKAGVSEPYSEDQVLSTYGSDCHICKKEINLLSKRSVGASGWQNSLHIDHVIPISKGGEDTISNVRPSHAICNLKKSNNHL